MNKQIILLIGTLYSVNSFAANTDSSEFELIPVMAVKLGYQTSVDGDMGRSSGDVVGLYGGLQFEPEWIWDFGIQRHGDHDFNQTNYSTLMLDSGLRYTSSFGGDFDIYGRFGVSYWSVESEGPFSRSSTQGLSPVLEAGVNYQLNSQFSMSLGYQYISWMGNEAEREMNSHAILLGLNYAFTSEAQKVDAAPQPQVTPAPVTPVVPEAPKTYKPAPVAKAPSSSVSDSYTSAIDTTAPIAKQPVTKQFERTIIGSTYFNFDSIQVSPNMELELLMAKDILTTYPQSNLQVVGHTDSSGSESYNQALSEKRAEAVAGKLVDRGINAEQLQVAGAGELEPVADNSTSIGRAENRRVELIALPFEYIESSEDAGATAPSDR